MKVVLLDGYVDEPSNFGVPPYVSPYPRYLAGAVRDAGHSWEYVTIDQVRQGRPLKGDLLAVISGPIVPGKYLRGLPISEREIVRHTSAFEGPRVFGGPLARFRYYDDALVEPFDWVALRDLDTAVHDHLATGEWTHRDRTNEEWDRWALLGADVVRSHPDFPEPLIVELDTSKGCVRYVNKGCSFCIEPMYGKPKFRPLEGILAEVRRLAGREPILVARGRGALVAALLFAAASREEPLPLGGVVLQSPAPGLPRLLPAAPALVIAPADPGAPAEAPAGVTWEAGAALCFLDEPRLPGIVAEWLAR